MGEYGTSVSQTLTNSVRNKRYYMTSFIERILWFALGYWVAVGMPMPECILGYCAS